MSNSPNPTKRLPEAPRRILAIKNKHIGDIICVLPALLALHRQFPQAKLDVIVSQRTSELVRGLPWIADVFEVPKKGTGWRRLREELALFRKVMRAGYDLVVDFTWSDRAMWYALGSGAKDRWAIQVTAGFFLKPYAYTNYGGKPNKEHHVVEHEREFLVKMGLPPYEPEFQFPPTPEEESVLTKWLAGQGIDRQRLVVVHPTSRWLFKCWHDERVAALVDWLADNGWQVVFTCGPDARELEKARAILKLTKAKVPTRLGDMTLRELAALLRLARFFFGMDSAPMHLAAAVNTPALALFGPSQVARWRPYGKIHQVIAGECHCLGREPLCDKSKVMDCLSKITLDQVQRVIETHFALPAAGHKS
ncbi:MAG: putative lipopolysaccharide heptosyltransferase III [Verrucomicrobiota bacterium]